LKEQIASQHKSSYKHGMESKRHPGEVFHFALKKRIGIGAIDSYGFHENRLV
jgi:hypothetical protein